MDLSAFYTTVTSISFTLQVEGIILAILLFFGVQSAWILMVEPPRERAS